MDATAIAMQQYAMQGANGVVGNVNGETSFTDAANTKNGDFAALIQTLVKNGSKAAGAQLLLKKGEENAQVIAAQMLAQNPLLAMLFAQNGISAESMQQMMSEAVMSGSAAIITQGLPQASGTAQSMQENLMLLTAQAAQAAQAAKAAAGVESETGSQGTQAFANVLGGQSSGAGAQAVTQAAGQQASQQAAAQAAVEPISAQVVSVTTAEKAKPEAAKLFEQANAETTAQRARITTVNPETLKAPEKKADGESAKEGEGEEALTQPKAEQTKAKSETKTDDASLNAAAQGSFEKRLEGAVNTQQPQSVKTEASNEVIRQTTQGIKQNLSLGKEEFVMKLKPEGLGEITVKLESVNGKTTLQLTAQNQNVQRMLQSEIEALKQAVRPYSIEVREIGSSSNSNLDMSFSSQNGSFEQQQQLFGQMNGRFAFNEGGYRHTQAFEAVLNGDEQDVSQDSTQPEIKLSSAMDTYI